MVGPQEFCCADMDRYVTACGRPEADFCPYCGAALAHGTYLLPYLPRWASFTAWFGLGLLTGFILGWSRWDEKPKACIAQDLQGYTITPDEIRALRGRKPLPKRSAGLIVLLRDGAWFGLGLLTGFILGWAMCCVTVQQ